jgi:O-antigen/teichoic acid export membrane protein
LADKLSKTLANVVYVFAADVVVKLVTATTTFVLARLLAPADYGVWITLALVVSYAPIVSLGSVETLVKEYPYHIGRGDKTAATRVERAVLGAIVLASVVLVVGGFAVSTLVGGALSPESVRLIRFMLLAAALTFVSAFYANRFAAHQRFDLVSLVNGWRAIVTGACLVALTWLWGLNGTVAGFIVAELAICVSSWVLSVRQCGRLTASYDLRLIWNVVRIGFPITLIWWAFIIQSTADRLISIAMLGEEATGFYGLGLSLVSLLVLLPITLSRVLYPKVSEKTGQTSEPHALRRLIVIPSQALSVLIPAAIGLLVIAAPIVYKQLLPKYGPGLASAQILLLGSFFICIVRTGMNYLIAVNRQHTIVKYVLVCMAINIVGNIVLVKSGFGIEGIALGSSVSSCILATLVWLAVFKQLGDVRVVQLKELGLLYLPYLIMLLLLAIYAVAMPVGAESISPQVVLSSGLFVTLFAGLIWTIPAIRSSMLELVRVAKTNLATRMAV